MIDLTPIIVAIITFATAISSIYLKERLFPRLEKQVLTIDKSNSYLKLDIICHKIREAVNSEGVYIAYFHNGGHFINGVGMDKYTVVGEDYSANLKSYKSQYRDILVNNFSYLFHNLLVANRHYIEDVDRNPNKDKGYKEDLKDRDIKSTYTFLIKDVIKGDPIGFISIEYKQTNCFSKESEAYIWKHQNEISNLLSVTKNKK